ncbi:MAG: MFS transporter, partial [Alphaproteobacteria bacterium]|nr:MFS transporter [Alphaproteobacteria bacterium]
MYLLAPLKRPPIALFWGGQVLSGVGDELRRVALVWIAIGLIGKDAAFISAAQAATMMVLSLWSGIYADRWDQRRTMIAVDLIRAVIALALAVAAGMEKLGVWAIFGATIAVAGLNSLYMPTVQASLGRLITGPDMMHALNGLMDGTRRLARVIGPALVGILALLVPIHHFFTINGATFLTAGLAALVLRHHLHRPPPPAGTPPRPAGF